MSLKLGILDTTTLLRGQTPAESLQGTLDLAAAADSLGFERYWVAEHHVSDAAQASPELLACAIAARTQKIKVGTGAVLLSLYSPLKIAGDFRLLSCLFPGRIELGLGRGIPSDPLRLDALGASASSAAAAAFETKLTNLMSYLRQEGDVRTIPAQGDPAVWVLGSASISAGAAARVGSAYGHAVFLSRAEAPDHALKVYEGGFVANSTMPRPVWSVAVAGCCAETTAEAEHHAKAHGNPFFRPTVVGSPAECSEMLHEFSHRFRTEEIVFLDITRGHAARIRSLKLLGSEICSEPAARCGPAGDVAATASRCGKTPDAEPNVLTAGRSARPDTG